MTFHLSENSDLWPDFTSYYYSLMHTPHIHTNKAKKKNQYRSRNGSIFRPYKSFKKIAGLEPSQQRALTNIRADAKDMPLAPF